MKQITLNFPTDGSSALKAAASAPCQHKARILPFPTFEHGACRESFGISVCKPVSLLRQKAMRIAASSEMFCSLKYEGFAGCAYGIFSRRELRFLVGSLSAIAALSILVGA